MMQPHCQRTWAEIDLDALAHNYHTLRAGLSPACKFLGLVKADAYGHGSVQIGKKLAQLGCEMLAVASVDEAMALRQGGLALPILCLGHTPPQLAPLLLEYEITQMVADLDTASALSQAALAQGKQLRVHVKIDTGMSRLGFLWQPEGDNGQLVGEIVALCALPGLVAEGLFTHLANADGDEGYTMEQLARFLAAKAALKAAGASFGISHCASSAAVLNYPCTHMDMVRPGIALFGYAPDDRLGDANLKNVMTLKSRIAAVRCVPKGSCVSYGCTATLTRDSRLAVLPIGYGDGYPRQLSGAMDVLLHGVLCPVVGRVCMDMCMVDVTDLPQVVAGDVALVYNTQLARRAAQITDTIVYELLCRVSARVPRIYLINGTEIQSK